MGDFDFKVIPKSRLHKDNENRLVVYKSRKYLVQVMKDGESIRITISKTKNLGTTKYPIWEDGISWDDIQHIKNAIGYQNHWCVECYPSRQETVNVANMRHLWLLDEAPKYGWKK
jgi:hypothetical protein